MCAGPYGLISTAHCEGEGACRTMCIIQYLKDLGVDVNLQRIWQKCAGISKQTQK